MDLLKQHTSSSPLGHFHLEFQSSLQLFCLELASTLQLAAGGCSLLSLIEKLLLSLRSLLELEMKSSSLVLLVVNLFHEVRVGSLSLLSSVFEDGLFSECSLLHFLLELFLLVATSLLALVLDSVVSLEDSVMLSDQLLSFVCLRCLSVSRLLFL